MVTVTRAPTGSALSVTNFTPEERYLDPNTPLLLTACLLVFDFPRTSTDHLQKRPLLLNIWSRGLRISGLRFMSIGGHKQCNCPTFPYMPLKFWLERRSLLGAEVNYISWHGSWGGIKLKGQLPFKFPPCSQLFWITSDKQGSCLRKRL